MSKVRTRFTEKLRTRWRDVTNFKTIERAFGYNGGVASGGAVMDAQGFISKKVRAFSPVSQPKGVANRQLTTKTQTSGRTVPTETVPVITSHTGSGTMFIDENTTVVATVVATGGGITYSKSGTDADDFAINPSTGVLTFDPAPDYEVPTDSNVNNMYLVTVTATNSAGSDSFDFMPIVQDVASPPDTTPTPTDPTWNPHGSLTSSFISVTLNQPALHSVEITLTSSTGGTVPGGWNPNDYFWKDVNTLRYVNVGGLSSGHDYTLHAKAIRRPTQDIASWPPYVGYAHESNTITYPFTTL